MNRKKLILNILISCFLTVCIMISSAGCMKNGLSAYEIAVENGFQGSESQWIDSLRGEKGEKGDRGDKGLTGWEGADGKNGLDGKDGADGKNGLDGKDGADGKNGLDGKDGADGKNGLDGKDGADGKDGTYIKNSYIDEHKHLILEMSDGKIIDAGYVGFDTEGNVNVNLKDKEVCVAPTDVYLLECNLKNAVFTTSDSTIARVASNGMILGVSEGRCTITATAKNGSSASCEVYVIDAEYSIKPDKTAVLTKYKGFLDEVILPESINGHFLTEIGDWAFFDKSDIKSVVLPETVSKIGYGAFSCCHSLQNITTSCLKYIGDSAFSSCENLKNIYFSEGLEYIGSSAFNMCASISTVTLPSTVSCINNSCFSGCTSLSYIDFGSVIEIKDYAFMGCTLLSDVNFPKTLAYIGEYAFQGCGFLTNVNFINHHTSYFKNSFEGCVFVPKENLDGFVTINEFMTTNADSNVRPTPSFENSPVLAIKKGTTVRVTGYDSINGWYKILINGEILFIRSSLLV